MQRKQKFQKMSGDSLNLNNSQKRRRCNETEMLQYLTAKQSFKMKSRWSRKFREPEGSFFRNRISIKQEMMVVYMRHRSLHTESEVRHMRNVDISRKLGIKISTVNTILRSWRSSIDKLSYFKRCKNKRTPKYDKEIISAIVQPKFL